MRSAGSILLLIILVPLTMVVFLVYSLQTNLLTSRFIKHELSSHNAYNIAEDQASQQIAKLKLDNLPVNTTDLQTLARTVLSAKWLQQNVESTLDRAFAWFNGPAGMTLSIPIDLRGPKAELIPGVEYLIQTAIPRMPICPTKHNATDLCRVPNMTVAQVEDILKQGGVDLQTVTTQLPDSFDLANPVLPDIKLGQSNQSSSEKQPKVEGASTVNKDQQKIDEQKKLDEKKKEEEKKQAGQGTNTMTAEELKKKEEDQKKQDEQKNTDQQKQGEQDKQNSQPPKSFQDQVKEAVQKLTDAKAKYHQGLQYWMDALIAYAVLILGCLAINIKGWRRFTRWFGILMLTIGLLPLAISIASKIVLEQKVLPLIHFDSSISADIQMAIPAAIRDVQHALFSPILLVSAIMVGLGMVAIIGACFIPRPKKKGQSPT